MLNKLQFKDEHYGPMQNFRDVNSTIFSIFCLSFAETLIHYFIKLNIQVEWCKSLSGPINTEGPKGSLISQK